MSSERNRASMRFRASAASRNMSIRGLEGWLEKKSKLGYWQKRFFRVLSNETKLGNHLAYFENTTTVTPKGIIPASEIDLVELYDRSKNSKSFTIAMVPGHNGKPSYLLRAPTPYICSKWLGALKPFAKSLSPMDVVTRSALIFVFNDAMVRAFAKLLKPRKVKKGEWVCRKGEKATDFYMLRDGKIGIFIRGKDGQEVHYCDQTPICFFGESVFINHSNSIPQRTASSKAMEDSELLVLSESDREGFFKQFGGIQGRLHVLLQVGINKRIEQVPFLSKLKTSELTKLKLGLHYRALKKGQVLFYEGDPGHEFYIVYAGSLKIVQFDSKSAEEILLKTVGKAECFGEIALMLSGIPRTATVIANTDTLLLSITEETFKSFLEIANLPMSVVMRERIVNTFKQYRIPFFDKIPKDSFHKLALECQVETYDAGDVIFSEGDVGDKFYIISFGQVAVNVDGKEIKSIGQGDYFGEIALVVEETPRTATCKCLTQTVLLAMSKDSFRKFFADRPESLADVELKIAGKKCQIRSILYHPKGVELFTTFLKQQYAEESMEFWHEVRAFRKWAQSLDPANTEDDAREMLSRAEDLLEKYIREGVQQHMQFSHHNYARWTDAE